VAHYLLSMSAEMPASVCTQCESLLVQVAGNFYPTSRVCNRQMELTADDPDTKVLLQHIYQVPHGHVLQPCSGSSCALNFNTWCFPGMQPAVMCLLGLGYSAFVRVKLL